MKRIKLITGEEREFKSIENYDWYGGRVYILTLMNDEIIEIPYTSVLYLDDN